MRSLCLGGVVFFELGHEVGDDLALTVCSGDRELGVEDDVMHGLLDGFVVSHDVRQLVCVARWAGATCRCRGTRRSLLVSCG